MPKSPLLALALASACCFACGADPVDVGDDDDDDDDVAGPDAAVETDLPVPESGFQVVTPNLTIEAGQEITYCYYTTLPPEAEVGVKKWESKMTPGSHHLIMFFLDAPGQPDGTVDTACGGGTAAPVWTYAASEPEHDQVMPEGVGMTVAAGQPVMIQMHYLNASEEPLEAHVTLNGHTFEGDYIKAAAYVTFNTQINVPPHSAGSVTGVCDVPPGVKFFTMSTHAHHFSTLAQVSDADVGTMLVETDDWEHPDVADWQDDPFFSFGSKLTYHCEYQNDTDNVVRTGDSAATDEMCMAVGYFFPATAPVFCLDSQVF